MNAEFVILNEGKNPRVACGREHGFFPSFRMTGKGQTVYLLPPCKPHNGLLRLLAMTGRVTFIAALHAIRIAVTGGLSTADWSRLLKMPPKKTGSGAY
jgi:hypothetical protein